MAGGYDNDIGANSITARLAGATTTTSRTNSPYATIPGGQHNTATNYAFAAGRRAKANHTGGFVWGDLTDADLVAWTPNYFLVRATGGVAFYTDASNHGVNLPNGRFRLACEQ